MANFLVRLCTSAVTASELKAPEPQQPWHIPRRQIRPPPPSGGDCAHVYQQKAVFVGWWRVQTTWSELSKGLGQGWSCASAMLVASGADARIRRSREIAHLRRRVRNLLTWLVRARRNDAKLALLANLPTCRKRAFGLRVASLLARRILSPRPPRFGYVANLASAWRTHSQVRGTH